MKPRRYRIMTATMAFLPGTERRATVTVPAEVVVAISEDLPDGDHMIDVVWNEKSYLMFAQDLRERGEPVS
jgi:hypothetical protein